MAVTSVSAPQFGSLNTAGGPLTLIDVRTPAEFEEVHVDGARNIPLDRLDPAQLSELRGQEVYVICKSGARGRQACEKLSSAGFSHIINIEGGTMACVEAGLKVTRGRATISLERQVRIAAGALVLIGSALTWCASPSFLALPAFVGAGLLFAGITDTCGMALLLSRMPWNQRTTQNCCR